jgi:hypothetical protein
LNERCLEAIFLGSFAFDGLGEGIALIVFEQHFSRSVTEVKLIEIERILAVFIIPLNF